ncbi:MAG: hypothetical protein ACP5RH_17620 [Leptodesmis sp.]|uniref:hypothetical protein n=1 Tax=Leptodesmis sp. TaxID=3100501 RepID=UPI003D0A31B9
MRLKVECQLAFKTRTPTPAIFMLRPRSGYGQWVMQEEYLLEPSVPVVEYTDSYGNLCQRLVVPTGEFKIYTPATADAADEIDMAPGVPFVPVEKLPESVIQFLLPSRYCQADLVGDRWYTFDATQDKPRGNRIAIAYGRDAADVALSTQFGPMQLLEMKVGVDAVK